MPTSESRTQLNAQRWLTEKGGKEPSARRALQTMQKATGYLAEYFAWLQCRNLVDQSIANPFSGLHYPKTLMGPKKYEALTYGDICLVRAAAVSKGDDLMVRYIDIARFTGMGLSEIGALTSDSIEFVAHRALRSLGWRVWGYRWVRKWLTRIIFAVSSRTLQTKEPAWTYTYSCASRNASIGKKRFCK